MWSAIVSSENGRGDDDDDVYREEEVARFVRFPVERDFASDISVKVKIKRAPRRFASRPRVI